MKRIFDILFALTLLILLSPMAVFIAILIYYEDRGPVFCSLNRVGKDNRPIRILKFRTMHPGMEKIFQSDRLVEDDDPHLTKVGAFIRSVGIDELPQLINVLRGELSIVGPRAESPEVVASLSKKLPRYRLRSQVLPGITGLAQIYSGPQTAPSQKLRYDLFYMNSPGGAMELRILARTASLIMRAEWQADEGVKNA
jgi:lipopolysaccharide/colanic/teichoic acid biosynthesis glycosyltransferase